MYIIKGHSIKSCKAIWNFWDSTMIHIPDDRCSPFQISDEPLLPNIQVQDDLIILFPQII